MKIKIPQFAKGHILVIGDVMLDRYLRGDALRISPEAPVPVVHVQDLKDSSKDIAGGAANVAINISSLGGKVDLLGLVGDDANALSLKNILTEAHVLHDLVVLKEYPTINKLRVIGHNQQLIRLDFEKNFQEIEFAELLERFKKHLKNANVVILSDYGKGTLHLSAEFIRLANAAKIPVLVDPKNKDFNVYRGAALIKPNLSEFEAVVGKCKDENDLVSKAKKVLDEYDFQAILITRGAVGMSLITRESEPLHLPARAREVFDVTGAGDTVIATLGASLAAGEKLADAVILANAAAGVVVRKLGTAKVSTAELRRAMQRKQDPWAAILDEETLMQQVTDARLHGERIIMTNGCFDILHSGHVTYLEKAKELGDRLIIAVNDDASVKRLKGNDRPINSTEQRMLVLAALRAVDWVVSFSEDTPERLVAKINPDILVKGGDYQIAEIAGAKHVIDHGGEVVIVPLVEGFSTTSLIKRIKKNK